MSNHNGGVSGGGRGGGGVSGGLGWTGAVAMLTALSPELRNRVNAYRRAAKYLSAGQDMPEIVNWQWAQPR